VLPERSVFTIQKEAGSASSYCSSMVKGHSASERPSPLCILCLPLFRIEPERVSIITTDGTCCTSDHRRHSPARARLQNGKQNLLA